MAATCERKGGEVALTPRDEPNWFFLVPFLAFVWTAMTVLLSARAMAVVWRRRAMAMVGGLLIMSCGMSKSRIIPVLPLGQFRRLKGG